MANLIRQIRITKDFNARSVFFLTCFSILIIGLHRYGAFDIKMSLLEHNAENLQYSGFSSGNVKISYREDMPATTCYMEQTGSNNMCGITIVLRTSDTDGRDLSKYKEIELDIKATAPFERNSVRFSLRNFHENYSVPDDFVSLKFNSITFSPSNHPKSITVPMKSFEVENWWIKQKNISFEDAQLDFSNVMYAEVITHDMPVPGEYSLRLDKAVFSGEFISENELLQLLLLLWLAWIIFLINFQKNKLFKASTSDTLTKFMNRRGISNWVRKQSSHFSTGQYLTMFYFDLDDFKKVNDSYGHLVGDEYLCAFSKKVHEATKPYRDACGQFRLARLSGDEFCLVFKSLSDTQIDAIMENIFAALQEGIELSCGIVKLGMSVGIASTDDKTNDFECLLSRADSAMYHAKKHGKNQYKIFDDSVSEEIQFRKEIAEKLLTAIKNNQFSLKFMPMYDVTTLQITGAEVLIRCEAQSLQGYGPDVFIPIAEDFSIIKDIDLWVIESTFKIMSQQRQFFADHPMLICINISAVELHNKYFIRDLQTLLCKYDIDTQYLEMEITETSLVETDELSIGVLKELHELGIKLALDDFGTGYTAFSQLMNYPVDSLKIDKSFIDDLLQETESSQTMLQAIFSIAHAYGLKTVAEGVETEAQYEYIKQRGCDFVQGYYFSKPITWQAFDQLVTDTTNLYSTQSNFTSIDFAFEGAE